MKIVISYAGEGTGGNGWILLVPRLHAVGLMVDPACNQVVEIQLPAKEKQVVLSSIEFPGRSGASELLAVVLPRLSRDLNIQMGRQFRKHCQWDALQVVAEVDGPLISNSSEIIERRPVDHEGAKNIASAPFYSIQGAIQSSNGCFNCDLALNCKCAKGKDRITHEWKCSLVVVARETIYLGLAAASSVIMRQALASKQIKTVDCAPDCVGDCIKCVSTEKRSWKTKSAELLWRDMASGIEYLYSSSMDEGRVADLAGASKGSGGETKLIAKITAMSSSSSYAHMCPINCVVSEVGNKFDNKCLGRFSQFQFGIADSGDANEKLYPSMAVSSMATQKKNDEKFSRAVSYFDYSHLIGAMETSGVPRIMQGSLNPFGDKQENVMKKRSGVRPARSTAKVVVRQARNDATAEVIQFPVFRVKSRALAGSMKSEKELQMPGDRDAATLAAERSSDESLLQGITLHNFGRNIERMLAERSQWSQSQSRLPSGERPGQSNDERRK